MPSVVDVCNRALDKLGQQNIMSLLDGDKRADVCNRTWPIVRDQMLRDHPWNFAIKRENTAPLATAPDWGFTYSHPIPTNCLRLLEVDGLNSTEYQIEGRNILADEDVLYIRYVDRIEDPNEFDTSFVDALATRMAFEMCEAFTQSNSKKDSLWQEYQASVKKARMIDAQENPRVEFVEDDWVTARI